MNRGPSFKMLQEMYKTLMHEEIQQYRNMNAFNIVALSTPILATVAGLCFMNGGQPAGVYIASVGTFTTSVCIPLATVSGRHNSRRVEKLKRELLALMEKV